MARAFIFYLLSLTLRSLVLAAFAGLLLMKSRSVAFRHAAWTVVLGSMLLIPIADLVLPKALVPASVPEVIRPIQAFIVVAPESAVQSVPRTHTESTALPIDGWQIAVVLGMFVTFSLLTRFAFVLCKVQRIKKRSLHIEDSGCVDWKNAQGVSLAESPALKVPITIGFWKPLILLPSDWRAWEDWKLRAVLIHEWTHVRRRDWAIATVAALARCVFWFNPLVWWLERRLASLAELASDEASVRESGNPQRYAETLLQFAAAARQGHRWIGGVAMAQHKISLRIERVLALQRPGSGILPRTMWVLLFVTVLPALYASAASQSAHVELPTLSTAAIATAIQEPTLPAPSPQAERPAQPPVLPPVSPAPEPAPTTAPPSQVAPGDPPPPNPNPPVPVNPELVGEIRLILALVDSQFQFQTTDGTNRWTGSAVWNIQNTALSSATWGVNANAFTFTLTGVQNRIVQFENANGGSFSYGCPDCSFLVWESGVGEPSATQAPGIIFQFSPDGRVLSARCRAAECRVGGVPATAQSGVRFSLSLPLAFRGGVCFSVFGDRKLDGTPFTSADCLTLMSVTSTTPLIFSVRR
jgi:beta-lactamase regulating signal transducer with metallopeptidase domain